METKKDIDRQRNVKTNVEKLTYKRIQINKQTEREKNRQMDR